MEITRNNQTLKFHVANSAYSNSIIKASFQDGEKSFVKIFHFEWNSTHEDYSHIITFAVRHGCLDVFEFLNANGGNLHYADDFALRLAAEFGQRAIVQFLHQNGANIHARDNFALKWAAKNGHLDVVRFLHSAGADILNIGDDAHQEVKAYIDAKSWLLLNVKPLMRLSGKVYAVHYDILPDPDTIPEIVTQVLTAAKM